MPGRSLPLSFRDAFRGIVYVVGSQRNARIQWGIGLAAFVMGVVLQLPARDWAILALTVAVVLAAEAVNTSLETIVDIISPEISESARIAKDAAAGAVLLLAMGAVAVGLFILGPPLWLLLFKA